MPKNKMTVQEILGAIDFSPDNIVAEAAKTAGLFSAAVEYRIIALEEKSAAKIALEREQADGAIKMRSTARKLGEKVTERTLEELIIANPKIQVLIKTLAKAETRDEDTKLLLETIRIRRDCLQIVGGLMRNELGMAAASEMGAEKLAAARRKLNARFSKDEDD